MDRTARADRELEQLAGGGWAFVRRSVCVWLPAAFVAFLAGLDMARKAKLLLHVGPQRTGSTFIQKYCSENRDRFLQLGVTYPKTARLAGISPYGQHEAVEKVKTFAQAALDEYFTRFVGADTVLISSENFSTLSPDELAKLHHSLSPFDVRIIFYRRNCLDLLPSTWQERVKHGATHTFQEFLLPHVLKPLLSRLINHAIVLDQFASVFGKERITIIDYDAVADDILRPVFELLNVQLPWVEYEQVNHSMTPELAEIVRALNVVASQGGKKGQIGHVFLNDRSKPALRTHVSHLTTLVHADLKPLTLHSDFAKPAEIALRESYAPNFYGEISDMPPTREILASNGNWMLNHAAWTACESIYRQIR